MLEQISHAMTNPEAQDIAIYFGRYSDNNKSVQKIERWKEAETLFKEKKYLESIAAFFDYLADEEAANVVHEQTGGGGKFSFFQGSKIIRGHYDASEFVAEVVLAQMPAPNVPVMRRLLEMNFNLYYSRYAIREDLLVMLFNSDTETANPSKLYYALKELATKADKQDDLMVHDFSTLLPADSGHVVPIPDAEKEVKLRFLKSWIRETIELAETIDSEKYSGGIAYILLGLAYRIDYFIMPEGKLMQDLEKIVEIYFRKDDKSVIHKNHEMIECFQNLEAKDKEEVYPYLFRSRFTFSIVTPQNFKSIADAIYNANQNVGWYKENKHLKIAALISEYGFSYCQYSYSMPKPVSKLFQVFMTANYPGYIKALGLHDRLLTDEEDKYVPEKIIAAVNEIIERWQPKYPEIKFDTGKLKFDDPLSFNLSFTTEVEYLNLETK